jgi:hypothetical protein
MSWDFSTEPEFEEQLQWMWEYVRGEIYPVEPIAATTISTASSSRCIRP